MGITYLTNNYLLFCELRYLFKLERSLNFIRTVFCVLQLDGLYRIQWLLRLYTAIYGLHDEGSNQYERLKTCQNLKNAEAWTIFQ